jgi:hypothetical protein
MGDGREFIAESPIWGNRDAGAAIEQTLTPLPGEGKRRRLRFINRTGRS